MSKGLREFERTAATLRGRTARLPDPERLVVYVDPFASQTQHVSTVAGDS